MNLYVFLRLLHWAVVERKNVDTRKSCMFLFPYIKIYINLTIFLFRFSIASQLSFTIVFWQVPQIKFTYNQTFSISFPFDIKLRLFTQIRTFETKEIFVNHTIFAHTHDVLRIKKYSSIIVCKPFELESQTLNWKII